MLASDNMVALASPAGCPLGSATGVPNLANVLVELHGFLRQVASSTKNSKWLEALPTVAVKEAYLLHQGPPAKGEKVPDPAKGDYICGRAYWPSELKEDLVVAELEGFKEFLQEMKNKKDFNLDSHMLNLGRVLGALHIQGSEATVAKDLVQPSTLVALYTSGAYKKLLNMPLLHPKYRWSLRVIDALMAFCQYQLRELAQRSIRAEEGPWEEYTRVLNSFVSDLKGGHRKRCEELKTESLRKKAAEDYERLENLPPLKELQDAVFKAFLCLQALAKEWSGKDSLPASVQRTANSCMAGAFLLGTFQGRHREWELAELSHVQAQLAAGLNFLVCTHHKTSKTYGDLAKYLPPGLQACMRCYLTLPRPEGAKYFLVPAQGEGTVSLSSCQRTFAKNFLPKTVAGGAVPRVQSPQARPTTNLIRKQFHTALMKLTSTKEKLQDLMKLVDAHSKHVQDRHYCLRGPKDDVELAKVLVETLWGETVPWPSEEQLEEFLASKDQLATWLAEAMDGSLEVEEEVVDEEDEEEDEVVLDWWEVAGDFFGIPKEGLVPLAEALPDMGLQLVPLVPAGPEPDMCQEGKQEKKRRRKGGNTQQEEMQQGSVVARSSASSSAASSSVASSSAASSSGLGRSVAKREAEGLEGVEPEPKLPKFGNESKLLQTELDWVKGQLKDWGSLPPNAALRDTRQKGFDLGVLQTGELDSEKDFQTFRQACRTLVTKMKKAGEL